MNDILGEIKQDIQREKYLKAWNKHGKKVSYIVCTTIVLIAFFMFYASYQTRSSLKASDLFINYLELKENGASSEKLEKVYKEIQDVDNGKIFSILVDLNANSVGNDVKYNRSQNYDFYVELVLFRKFIDGNTQVSEQDFKYLRKEYNLIEAFLALEQDDMQKAREHFSKIIIDPSASENFRVLALEFITYLDENK